MMDQLSLPATLLHVLLLWNYVESMSSTMPELLETVFSQEKWTCYSNNSSNNYSEKMLEAGLILWCISPIVLKQVEMLSKTLTSSLYNLDILGKGRHVLYTFTTSKFRAWNCYQEKGGLISDSVWLVVSHNAILNLCCTYFLLAF